MFEQMAFVVWLFINGGFCSILVNENNTTADWLRRQVRQSLGKLHEFTYTVQSDAIKNYYDKKQQQTQGQTHNTCTHRYSV